MGAKGTGINQESHAERLEKLLPGYIRGQSRNFETLFWRQKRDFDLVVEMKNKSFSSAIT